MDRNNITIYNVKSQFFNNGSQFSAKQYRYAFKPSKMDIESCIYQDNHLKQIISYLQKESELHQCLGIYDCKRIA